MRRSCAQLVRNKQVRNVLSSASLLRRARRRYIGGEDLSGALAVAAGLNRDGITATINHVGTHLKELPAALAATEEIISALKRINEADLSASVSIKLTQIGLDLDYGLCREQVFRILETARSLGRFVWIDMEEAAYVEQTLTLFDELRSTFSDEVLGIALQSYLKRGREDLQRLLNEGARVRLVKGGYWESSDAAYRKKQEIINQFREDLALSLEKGAFVALATHNAGAIAQALRISEEKGIERSRFEFQMLYGVQTELQHSLAERGYNVCCYIPYGMDWYTYVLGCLRKDPFAVFSPEPNGRRH